MFRVPWHQGCASEAVTTPESFTLWLITYVFVQAAQAGEQPSQLQLA